MTVETVILIIFCASLVTEAAIYLFPVKSSPQRILNTLDLILIAFSTSTFLLYRPDIFSLLYLIVSPYRIINILRLSLGRMNENYLRSNCVRTSVILASIHLLIVLGYLDANYFRTDTALLLEILVYSQLAASFILLVSVRRNLKKTSWPKGLVHYSDDQLPDVSVLIPARNETDDLEQCLKTLIASDYKKLEIIVLDDCSQNRHTPEIIRGFAHDGVRFIKGKNPSDSWLPKNQAYDRLASEANGQYLMFCGVDIRFEQQTIRKVIGQMVKSEKQMYCVLPRREPMAYGRMSVFQAMRYWWELALPRRLFNRPPALSSCWVIKKDALQDSGGFEAARRSVIPEAYFAKQLIKKDQYSFRRADKSLGLSSVKSPREQRDTAVRMRYPQVHRRPENVLLNCVFEVFLMFSPYVLLVTGHWLGLSSLDLLVLLVTCVILSAGYVIVALETKINNIWFGIIGLPVIAIVDICMLNISMWCYEFSVVTWRERNVCVPAMYVFPKLPDAK